MNKFRIFLSHITEEREVAIALKKGIEELYLNSIQVFVSSDRECLRGGDQWLIKILKELKSSDLVLILTSKLSISRPWINFEAGGGWFLKKPVIPLCYNGILPSGLSEPLHSLQAINIEEAEYFKTLFEDISSYSDLGVPKESDIFELHNKVLSKKNVDIQNNNKEESSESDKNISKSSAIAIIEKNFDFLDTDPTVFFNCRMAEAFPGLRDLVWINDSKKAVYHLSHLLKDPLVFKSKIRDSSLVGRIYPIWWFRGSACLGISHFEILSDTKILINNDELEIDKIAIYRSSVYYRNFVYIETKAESQTGLYNITEEDIERHINDFGYSNEEYGLLDGKHFITRQEFDDGSAIINGKIADAEDAKLRVRFLSKYNFIICAQSSPYNSTKHDIISIEYFNGILNGTYTFEDYLNSVVTLPPRDMY